MHGNRINWIDQARAISIILVVAMHSTLGVEKALGFEGWMHHVVAFATPFRIPAFFLISGLLLGSALRKPLAEFLDKRVWTLLYLYAVWVTIQFGFKAPGMIADHGAVQTLTAYGQAFVQPFGTLWFIYALPVFYLIARATRRFPPVLILALAIIAHIAPVHSGWHLLDQTADRFVYFYLGHFAVHFWHRLAEGSVAHPRLTMGAIAIWGAAHALLLGYATMPIVDIGFALAGAAALIGFASLLRFVPEIEPLRWVGRNTILVYLGFFLPMAITRTVLIKSGVISDAGTIALLTTLSAVVGSVIMYWLAQKTGIAKFIYRKPHFNMAKAQSWNGTERRAYPRMVAAE